MGNINLSSPLIGQEEIDAVSRVLRSHKLNMGRETQLFEDELKSYFNNNEIYLCSVNSGTSAINLALSAYGIGFGDEVLVPTFTFISTFQAISALGAKPIPCDIDFDDAFINLYDAKKRLTKSTKAIVPVLFAGCDKKINSVYKFAEEHSIKVIEDAAHSFGTKDITKRKGALCFSFDAIKNITCGDGGVVVTHDDKIFNIMKDARLLGVIGDTEARFDGKRSWDFDTEFQGFRYHLNSVSAAIGRAQLSKFGMLGQKRKKYSARYLEAFKNMSDDMQLFPIDPINTVPHIFPIIVKRGKRDALKQFLIDNGIESGVQYKPNHLLSFYNLGYNLPNSEKLYNSILSIPLHPRLEDEDINKVIIVIKRFFHGL